MTIPAIILSAGASKRMGFPKAMLAVGRRTLLEDQVRRLKRAGCGPIIVVLGAEARTVIASLRLSENVIPAKACPTEARAGIQKCLKLLDPCSPLTTCGDKLRRDDKMCIFGQPQAKQSSEHNCTNGIASTRNAGLAMTRLILNNLWPLGQFSSIKCGLKALSSTKHGCLILPVDTAFVPVSVMRKILVAAELALLNSCKASFAATTPSTAVIPIFIPSHHRTILPSHHPAIALSHQKGHPIWVSHRLIKKILRTPSKTGRLDLIVKRSKHIRLIEAGTPAILNNVNTPSEWKQYPCCFKRRSR